MQLDEVAIYYTSVDFLYMSIEKTDEEVEDVEEEEDDEDRGDVK